MIIDGLFSNLLMVMYVSEGLQKFLHICIYTYAALLVLRHGSGEVTSGIFYITSVP